MSKKNLIKNSVVAAAILGAALSATGCGPIEGPISVYGPAPEMDTETWEETESDTDVTKTDTEGDTDETESDTEDTAETTDEAVTTKESIEAMETITEEDLVICYYGVMPENMEE